MKNKQRILIGKEISAKRNQLKLTQQEAAYKCGLSRSYLADIETGRYCPSIKSLVSIANTLDIDLNFLFTMLKSDLRSEGNGK